MSDLYDALKLYDPKIAAIYMEDTRDRPNAKISLVAAKKIYAYALADNRITDKEAGALGQLLTFGKFTDDAILYLFDNLKRRVSDIYTEAPNKEFQELVAHSLTSAVTQRIQFVSKYTNIQYSPVHYAAIAKLIDGGEIKVWVAPGGSSTLL